MTTYSTRIIHEQGGSVLTVASAGSLNVNAGGTLVVTGTVVTIASSGSQSIAAGGVLSTSGTFRVASASAQIGDGASLIIKPGATTKPGAFAVLNIGQNQMWYAPGSAGSPTFSGSPGDMLWIANSASTTFWFNTSDGTAGSVWRRMAGILSTSAAPPAGP